MSPNSKRQFQMTKIRDLFRQYQTGEYFDEMFQASDRPRPHYRQLYEQLQALSVGELPQYQDLAMRAF